MVLQVKNCSETFEIGSLLLILGRITILHANLNTPEPQHGGSMVNPSQIGNILAQVHSCGYMGNVSASRSHRFRGTHDCHHGSWGWEEHPLVHQYFHAFPS